MNRLQAAAQFRKALQMFAASLADEKAMEVATIYDPWTVDKAYIGGEFLTYGQNSVGDPQLYKVAQAHTSQVDWKPDLTPALYVAIGLDEQGYPVLLEAGYAAINYAYDAAGNRTKTIYMEFFDPE